MTDSHGDEVDGEVERLTGKPYKYTGELAGRRETRHEAIGAETIACRERAKIRFQTKPTPKGYCEAISRVHAFETYICDYCRETFLYEGDYEEHKTCPWWKYDQGDREVMPSAE